MRVPFNRPFVTGREFEYIRDAIGAWHISGGGPYSKRCQALLEDELAVPRVLLTSSCTDALEMSALLLDISPGDEFIVPAFTFVSTANAFVLRGAKPIFIDSRADTLNADESLLESLVTERTRAIVVVHYAGVGCEMDAILDVARRHAISVVEDNAHGLFGRYRGQYLGTFGALATQSFHETKNFTCGEGGALLVNEAHLVDRAEIIWEKGTNRSRFFRGQVDKYTWVDVGSSFLPSDIQAAFLFAQLEQRERIQRRRQEIWDRYAAGLAEWATQVGAALPVVPSHCEQAYHLFYALMPTLADRQALIAHLRERGVASVFHYLPLNTSEMGQRLGGRAGQCPVAESTSDRLLRLPFFNDISDEDVDYVIEATIAFRPAG